jgi:hypothetical protein
MSLQSAKALQNPYVQRQLAVASIPGKPTPNADLTALMSGS